jgi:hypothetical protein
LDKYISKKRNKIVVKTISGIRKGIGACKNTTNQTGFKK